MRLASVGPNEAPAASSLPGYAAWVCAVRWVSS
jgi:hypothetical protein